ncbi:sirohydrochlorin chelatase [Congregicoccus parvus]|uniref:sirohydrochlorin chelatase n=1 Tax=Congregicoccus parvus TaxID=3081749 RepID=UPI003FA54CDD
MHFSDSRHVPTLLVDNGSLRPDSVLALRALAAAASIRTGTEIEPVSLLHSSAIPAEKLDGRRAPILEPELRARCAAGNRRFRVLPLFFGPSAALTDYIPERVAHLQETFPDLRVDLARPIVDADDAGDDRIARALAERVCETRAKHELTRPHVVLVDHGSPRPGVARVRDHVARQLACVLGEAATSVTAASMERREGEAYAFNEPLLARALEALAVADARAEIVVALMFFSPGRHAGAGGDIAEICADVVGRFPDLRVRITDVLGAHPGLIDVLTDRWRELAARDTGAQTDG